MNKDFKMQCWEKLIVNNMPYKKKQKLHSLVTVVVAKQILQA